MLVLMRKPNGDYALLTEGVADEAVAEWDYEPIGSAPPEPHERVIVFTRAFDPGGKAYTYAAIRADDGKWSVTSKSAPQRVSWPALCHWLTLNGEPPVVSVVTATVALPWK